MKTTNILNAILIGVIVSIFGYMLYIQSKRGIALYGTDRVIDPFVYDTGKFSDVINGVNPYSQVYQLTQEELQDIKSEKIKKAALYLIPPFLILILINRKKDDTEEIRESENINSPNKEIKVNLTDDEELRLSFLELAIKMACHPQEVKNCYLREIVSNDFEYSDLVDAEKAWKNKKQEDALIMGINPENTPAALMERWTREFRISTFKE